jgi:hypothetical protein
METTNNEITYCTEPTYRHININLRQYTHFTQDHHFILFDSFHFTSYHFNSLYFTTLNIFHLPEIWNFHHQGVCVSQRTACLAVLTWQTVMCYRIHCM